jgi:hypothetical protein
LPDCLRGWRRTMLGGLGTGGIAPLATLFHGLPISVQVSSGGYQSPVHEATVLYAGSAPTRRSDCGNEVTVVAGC